MVCCGGAVSLSSFCGNSQHASSSWRIELSRFFQLWTEIIRGLMTGSAVRFSFTDHQKSFCFEAWLLLLLSCTSEFSRKRFDLPCRQVIRIDCWFCATCRMEQDSRFYVRNLQRHARNCLLNSQQILLIHEGGEGELQVFDFIDQCIFYHSL